jgi:hypothetical protein
MTRGSFGGTSIGPSSNHLQPWKSAIQLSVVQLLTCPSMSPCPVATHCLKSGEVDEYRHERPVASSLHIAGEQVAKYGMVCCAGNIRAGR